MSKPEWGVKRLCQSCGAKFYDLQRTPVHCPRCGAAFDPDAVLRSRRARAQPASRPEAARVVKAPTAAALDPGGAKEDAVPVAAKDDLDEELDEEFADGGGETLIEDTSELGEDDVSEVVAGADDEDDADG